MSRQHVEGENNKWRQMMLSKRNDGQARKVPNNREGGWRKRKQNDM